MSDLGAEDVYPGTDEVRPGIFISPGDAVYIRDDEGEVVMWTESEMEDPEAFTACAHAVAIAASTGPAAVRKFLAESRRPSQNPAPAVPAKVWSDDRVVSVDFDAGYWVENADTQELIDLHSCGFRGDYAADSVAIYTADYDENVQRVFKYLELIQQDPAKKDCRGFECSVDKAGVEDFLRWQGRSIPWASLEDD